jgi:hypothetical protein
MPESQIICRVRFGPTGHGGFGLTVAEQAKVTPDT